MMFALFEYRITVIEKRDFQEKKQKIYIEHYYRINWQNILFRKHSCTLNISYEYSYIYICYCDEQYDPFIA